MFLLFLIPISIFACCYTGECNFEKTSSVKNYNRMFGYRNTHKYPYNHFRQTITKKKGNQNYVRARRYMQVAHGKVIHSLFLLN